MSNVKSSKLFLALVSTIVVAASACKLDPPAISGGVGGGSQGCNEDMGMPGTGGGGGTTGSGGGAGGNNIDNVVMAVACPGPMALTVDFKYAPGYVPDTATKAMSDSVVDNMSRADRAAQMRGTYYSSGSGPQFSDIQRSYDTKSVRGFRYRDASRGVNFAEDMAGHKPNAAYLSSEFTGLSTTFPVSMSRGAAFDLDLEYAIGEAIGDEMQAAKETLLLAPCMNLLRHPFWGRAQETYGEDSYHIGRLATAMVVGVQQHIAANAKHYMAYDVELKREQNNSDLDEQTLREAYGRHFRMVVQDGGVSSVMASYNKVNGIKSTQNAHILTDVLRTDFGFNGFVLSDWWAMPASMNASTDTTILKNDAVMAVKAGLDVDLPWALSFGQLESIVQTNSGLTDDDLKQSAKRVMEQKYRFNAYPLTGKIGLGTPKTSFVQNQIQCDGGHIKLAEQAALESMVLLKNDSNTLPIPGAATKIAVVGASVPYVTKYGGSGFVNFAQDTRTGDLGSSRVYSDPAKEIGPFAGICKAAGGTPTETRTETSPSQFTKTSGTCDNAPAITVTTATTNNGDISPVLTAAMNADFVVVVAGLTAEDEGEEYTQAADRTSFALDAKQTNPTYMGFQNKVIQMVAALGKPMVVVLEGASVIDVQPWIGSVPALVMAWYPGMVGGSALGRLLLGQANFSAKLPITWGKQPSDYDTWVPVGSTTFNYYTGYHWFDLKGTAPQFPFGFGLSYTKFDYKKLQLGCSTMAKDAVLPVVVNVANSGTVAGDEVVMVFVKFLGTTARRPAKELKGFARVHLEAGEEKQITIPVRLKDLDYFQADSAGATTGKWIVETGNIEIDVGGGSTGPFLTGTVAVTGYTTP